MPEILVRTGAASRQTGVILLRERVNVADFESHHFTAQLIERLGWAVGDADAVERARPDAENREIPAAGLQSEPRLGCQALAPAGASGARPVSQ